MDESFTIDQMQSLALGGASSEGRRYRVHDRTDRRRGTLCG